MKTWHLEFKAYEPTATISSVIFRAIKITLVKLCVDLTMMLMMLMPRAARFTPQRSDYSPKSRGFLSGPPTTTYRSRLASAYPIGALVGQGLSLLR